jgi:hypothetical protein
VSAGAFEIDGEMGEWEEGDTITFKNGQRAMVTAVGSISYQLRNLDDWGVLLMTPQEIRESQG